jgi:hypothetical protein
VTNEDGRAARSTAWGVAAGVLAAGAIGTWQVALTTKPGFPIVLAYVFGGLSVGTLLMCFSTVWGWWPTSRGPAAVPSDAAQLPAADIQTDHGVVSAADPTGPQSPAHCAQEVIADQSDVAAGSSGQASRSSAVPDAEVARGAAGVTNVIDGTINGSVIQAGTISGPVTINDPGGKNQGSPAPGGN